MYCVQAQKKRTFTEQCQVSLILFRMLFLNDDDNGAVNLWISLKKRMVLNAPPNYGWTIRKNEILYIFCLVLNEQKMKDNRERFYWKNGGKTMKKTQKNIERSAGSSDVLHDRYHFINMRCLFAILSSLLNGE